MKTRKSALKRFKITKKGKVLFLHQNSRHLMRHKSKRQIRRQRRESVLEGAFAKKIKQMIGYA